MKRITMLCLIALTVVIAVPAVTHARDDDDDMDRRERTLNRRERDLINRERDEIRRERSHSRGGGGCQSHCMAESNQCNRSHGGANALNGCGIQRVQCLSKC
jgi:hypothetical protein